jgi:hypothetical protein
VPDAKSFPARKAFFVLFLLLAVTVSWKIVVQLANSDAAEQPSPYAKMAEFLTRQHFNVAVAKNLEEGVPTIRADSGPCRLLVATTTPEGSGHDRLRSYVTQDDTIFVVYRGQVYAQQPVWETVLDWIWFKLRQELGSRPRSMPIFVVIARENCGAERLPWSEAY